MVKVRWLGTAGIELQHNGRLILLDPYLSRAGKADIFFRRLRPDRSSLDAYMRGITGDIAAVVCSHTHFDHALDIPGLARITRAPVMGCASLGALLAISGLQDRVTVCGSREPVRLEHGAVVTLVPSMHGLILGRALLFQGDIERTQTLPLRAHQYRMGTMHAVKVDLGGLTFMHIGSAGYLEQELHAHACDVLFLCAAGWKNTPGYPERVIDILKPSTVVPIHHDDFSLPIVPAKGIRVLKSADMPRFIERLESTGTSLEIRQIEPFEETTF